MFDMLLVLADCIWR